MRKRISLWAATGLVAVGLAATPAHAADPVFTLTSPSAIGLRPYPAQGGEAQKTTVEFRVDNTNAEPFAGPSTFTIDLRGLKGVAAVSLNEDHGATDCKLTADAVTCTESYLWPHDSVIAALDVSAAKDAKAGTTAGLTMTGTAAGATFRAATTNLTVGGPDLVLDDAGLRAQMRPGGTQALPIVFSNTGTESAQGLSLVLRTTRGMGLVEQYDNCSYSEDGGARDSWGAGWGTTVCTLDDEIETGVVYETTALTLKAAPYGFHETMSYAVYEKGGEPESVRPAPSAQKVEKSKTGKKLTARGRTAKAPLSKESQSKAPLSGESQSEESQSKAAAPRSADLDPRDNYREFDFEVANTADLVAAPVSLTGKAGETVKADFGFRNDGPAWVAHIRSGESVALTDIVIPAGAKVTKVPAGCGALNADGSSREERLGAPRYSCSSPHIVGEKQAFAYPFELKIEKVVEDAKGSIRVGQWQGDQAPEPQGWDPNHANNTAAFVINAKGGSGTATPGPTATATGAPAPGSSATPTAAPTPGSGAKPAGGLASTGSTAVPVAIGAAALVAAGAALLMAFRRRPTGRA